MNCQRLYGHDPDGDILMMNTRAAFLGEHVLHVYRLTLAQGLSVLSLLFNFPVFFFYHVHIVDALMGDVVFALLWLANQIDWNAH